MQQKVKLHKGEFPFKPLTNEEKVAKAMQILQQKREAFAVNILVGLCTNMGKDATNAHAWMMVDLAVEMADKLLKKLYPVEEKEDGSDE